MDKLSILNFDYRLNSTEKVFFYIFVEFAFRNNFENACLGIHFLANHMQIEFNSKKKNVIRFGKFLVKSGPFIYCSKKKKSKFDLASSSLIRFLVY